MKNVILYLLCSLAFCACSALTGDDTGAYDQQGGQSTVIGDLDAKLLEGYGFLLQGSMDQGGNAAHNFHLNFALPEGEKIDFFFFVSEQLTSGVQMSFERRASDVLMTLNINGISHQHSLTDFQDRDLDLDIDVHNDHTDIHILVWEQNGRHEDSEDCTFDGGCLYNTEDFAFDIWLGVGRAGGIFWGGRGRKDLVIKAEGPREAKSDA